jgi:hypothetical protein
MSMLYLAQPDQQQQLDWLAGGTLAILLDSAATDGQLMMGRFDVSEGEASPSRPSPKARPSSRRPSRWPKAPPSTATSSSAHPANPSVRSAQFRHIVT